jgi:hypothetical protein
MCKPWIIFINGAAQRQVRINWTFGFQKIFTTVVSDPSAPKDIIVTIELLNSVDLGNIG